MPLDGAGTGSGGDHVSTHQREEEKLMSKRIIKLIVAAAVCAVSADVQADLTMDMVTIGNPGNAPDLRYDPSGYGAVDYVYAIGKFEVTTGQYTEFLNAVAATDTYGLYDEHMCLSRICRSGSPGSYTYSVAPDWANRPVNYVSWGSAARFCNWMHNGQPTGPQDASTTEAGSYLLDGVTTDVELSAVVRAPDATWVIPSEDEWYKAAYHKNDGATGSYFDYPMGSDITPSIELIDPDPGNNATFAIQPDDFTIGSPYWRTDVGAHENSESPYGTFDQGGNVYEWNEAVYYESYRRFRGGSWGSNVQWLHASQPNFGRPSVGLHVAGFRVGRIPEPASILLLAGLGMLRWR